MPGRSLSAPDALLHVEGGNHHRLVVYLGRVMIQRSRSLGAEVAVAGVELRGGDTVFAADAGKLHAPCNPFNGVVSHLIDCSPRQENRRRKSRKESALESGSEGNARPGKVGMRRVDRGRDPTGESRVSKRPAGSFR